jgi:hypothetical protein
MLPGTGYQKATDTIQIPASDTCWTDTVYRYEAMRLVAACLYTGVVQIPPPVREVQIPPPVLQIPAYYRYGRYHRMLFQGALSRMMCVQVGSRVSPLLQKES